MKEFRGLVNKSKSGIIGCGRETTLIEVLGSTKKTFPLKEFNIPSRHRIDIGEHISVEYETHLDINWVRKYSILNRNGTKRYTSPCE
ncbi:hypothetical protein K8R30_03655 [archaeon]|nr:hypothetical protein [archaeon]